MSSSPTARRRRWSVPGTILAGIYVALAIGVVASDRGSQSGGWISLNGMASLLVTFPVSAPAELLGLHLDYRSDSQMGLAIGLCAVLPYLIGAGLARLFRRST